MQNLCLSITDHIVRIGHKKPRVSESANVTIRVTTLSKFELVLTVPSEIQKKDLGQIL